MPNTTIRTHRSQSIFTATLRHRLIALVLVVVGVSVLYMVACSDDTDVFKFASVERGVQLPADHAAHPDYQNEWWYYTGHLRARDGRRFGFQLTWFRVGLTAEQQRESKFRSRTLYFAHFTVTDKDDGTFYHAEKVSRGGDYDNAGADTRLLRTWIDDWRVERLGEMFYLSGRTDTMALSLIATPSKPVVLQGINGYSRKGDNATNATMYYSIPRMAVVGTLELNGELMEVDGQAWMDHEFGTSQLAANQVGWDWFSLQLDNNQEVMVYGLRRKDGSYDPNATGAFIAADGSRTPLALKDYTIDVLDHWNSPGSKATYPSKWRITIPSQKFEATITPYVADQELRTQNTTRITYWEGASKVDATINGQPVAGEGYVELTGYAGELVELK